MRDSSSPLGATVSKARKRLGYSQAELARLAGVSKSFISRIEQGDYETISLGAAMRLADVLMIDLAVLTLNVPMPSAPEDGVDRLVVVLRSRADGDEVAEILLALLEHLP